MLHTFVASHKGEIEEEDKKKLREFFEGRGEDIHGLDASEFEEIREAIKA